MSHRITADKVKLRADLLAGRPHLKTIAIAATGYDRVDIAAARARGIVVSNIRSHAKAAVPEHTFARILALPYSIVPYRASVLAGHWQEASRFCYFDHPIADLTERRLGIVGDRPLFRFRGHGDDDRSLRCDSRCRAPCSMPPRPGSAPTVAPHDGRDPIGLAIRSAGGVGGDAEADHPQVRKIRVDPLTAPPDGEAFPVEVMDPAGVRQIEASP